MVCNKIHNWAKSNGKTNNKIIFVAILFLRPITVYKNDREKDAHIKFMHKIAVADVRYIWLIFIFIWCAFIGAVINDFFFHSVYLFRWITRNRGECVLSAEGINVILLQ